MNKLLRFASWGMLSGSLLFVLAGTAAAQARPVPEIDPGTLASGIAIFAGAAFLLVEKFRRR